MPSRIGKQLYFEDQQENGANCDLTQGESWDPSGAVEIQGVPAASRERAGLGLVSGTVPSVGWGGPKLLTTLFFFPSSDAEYASTSCIGRKFVYEYSESNRRKW